MCVMQVTESLREHCSVTLTIQYKCKSFSFLILNLNPGEFERGVDHLTNAIAVCGQPQQLLQVLQQTLPPPVFQMLLTKLPTISQVRISCFSPFKISV